MQSVELKAQSRNQTGTGVARQIRREGNLPGVVYGRGLEPQPLQVNYKELDKILRSKLGKNTLIQLSLDEKTKHKVIVKDYQGHAITRILTHVDFMVVNESQKLHVRVPVRFTGKPIGIASGGLMEVVSREVELVCDLGHIPEEITVDVTNLNVGQNLHLSDAVLPTGVTYNKNNNVTLVTMSVVKEEAAAAVVPGAAAAAAASVPAANQKAPEAAAAAAPAKGAAKAPAKK